MLPVPFLAVFGLLDKSVLAGYFVLVTWVGIAVARREQDTDEYFLGGRSLPTWAVAVSIVASMLSAATFVSVPDASFAGDLSYLSLNVGAFAAVFIVAFFFVPRLYRAGTVTIYGFLAQRFGESARLAVSCTFIFGRMLASGARLFIAAIPLCLLIFGAKEPSAGQLAIAIALIGAVGIFYTVIGGVRAVVWVDTIQFGLVVGAALLSVGILLHRIPLSLREIMHLLQNTKTATGGGSKLHIFDTALNFSRPYTIWSAVFASVFLSTASYGVDQDMAQRFLISKSVVRGGISVIASQFIGIVVVTLFLCIGLLLFIFYRRPDVMGQTHTFPAAGISVYPWFLLNELPRGLSGLSIVGFFAIAQGSMDSAMNAVASSVVADVITPLRNRGKMGSELASAEASKLTVAAVGVLMCGFAFCCAVAYDPHQRTLLDFALGIMTFAFTGMLGVFITALLTRRGNSGTVIAALITGVLVVVLLQDSVMAHWSPHVFPHLRTLAWPWWMPIGTGASFLVCIAGSPKKSLS